VNEYVHSPKTSDVKYSSIFVPFTCVGSATLSEVFFSIRLLLFADAVAVLDTL